MLYLNESSHLGGDLRVDLLLPVDDMHSCIQTLMLNSICIKLKNMLYMVRRCPFPHNTYFPKGLIHRLSLTTISIKMQISKYFPLCVQIVDDVHSIV